MSKKVKLQNKLRAVPIPRDFSWNDLLTVMRSAGFKEECDGGSHYCFEHTSGFRLTISKTHPSGILKVYQVRAAIEALDQVGESGGD